MKERSHYLSKIKAKHEDMLEQQRLRDEALEDLQLALHGQAVNRQPEPEMQLLREAEETENLASALAGVFAGDPDRESQHGRRCGG